MQVGIWVDISICDGENKVDVNLAGICVVVHGCNMERSSPILICVKDVLRFDNLFQIVHLIKVDATSFKEFTSFRFS